MTSDRSASEATDLFVGTRDGEVVSGTGAERGEVRVVGDPLHDAPASVVETYRESTMEAFLDFEARYSCGNYAVVDASTPARIEVITSPGYCGGYVASSRNEVYVSTLLHEVVSEIGEENLEIDVPTLLRYFDRNQAYRTPFTTPFRGVSRLPGATRLTVRETEIDSVECYLGERVGGPSPPDFDGMMDEIATSLDARDVVLLYSGGVDSTALAVAMMRNDIDFDSVTVDIGPGYKDAPIRARRVADGLGFDTEVVEMAAPPEDRHTRDHVVESMRADLVSVRHPGLALGPDTVSPGDLILSGQNMDSLVMHNMENPWYSGGSTDPTSVGMYFKNLFDFWLPNVQFTDPYTGSELFRRGYLMAVPALYSLLRTRYPNVGPDRFLDEDSRIDPLARGVLRGLMHHRVPNLVPQRFERLPPWMYADFGDDLNALLEAEVDAFKEYVTRTADSSVLDLFEYYVYANNSNKQIATFPTPGGAVSHLPLSWGPATSLYVGRPNPLRQALSPKEVVYDYVEEYAGVSHQDLVGPSDYSVGWERTGSSLLSSHGHLLDPARSVVCETVSESGSSILNDVYARAQGLAARNSFRNGDEMILPHRVLNVELLLRNSFGD